MSNIPVTTVSHMVEPSDRDGEAVCLQLVHGKNKGAGKNEESGLRRIR